MAKQNFLDYPALIEEAQKINSISMDANRSPDGPASWTNTRTNRTYSVTEGGETALAKKIIADNPDVFGVLDAYTALEERLVRQSGMSTTRPDSPAAADTYFDTTLGKPIWYSGSGWVDAAGTAV